MGGRTLFALVALSLAAPARGADAPPVVELAGEAFGTSWRVRLVATPPTPPPASLAPRIEAALAAVDAALSGWRDDSELSRFNTSRATAWQPVSEDVARVAAAALAVHARSDGAFDPTLAPLVAAWGFGPAPRRLAPPPPEAVRAARARVDAGALAVRRHPPALRKARPDLALDLAAAAKGHAVDRVAEVLASAGVARFLVEIGGELRARGAGPGGGPWPVGIEAPTAGPRRAAWAVGLADAALATSSDHRDAFEAGGRRYGHVLDPRTGEPVEHGLASVSVLGDDALHADAWATALLVLGPEAGWRVAEREGLAVLFVNAVEGGFEARANAGFERHRLP